MYLQGDPAGVVFQSPLHFVATVTPMVKEATEAAVEAIVSAGVRLPGVVGEVATASHFAGHWAEQTKQSAHPTRGQRIYEVDKVVVPQAVPGELRQADELHRKVLVDWVVGFSAETGEGGGSGDPESYVERRLSTGQLWVWANRAPVAMAGPSSTQRERVPARR